MLTIWSNHTSNSRFADLVCGFNEYKDLMLDAVERAANEHILCCDESQDYFFIADRVPVRTKNYFINHDNVIFECQVTYSFKWKVDYDKCLVYELDKQDAIMIKFYHDDFCIDSSAFPAMTKDQTNYMISDTTKVLQVYHLCIERYYIILEMLKEAFKTKTI